jgi:dephospho-CoA kinase
MSTLNKEENTKYLDAIILMGPFGAGKSYLGKLLRAEGIADYIELEPIVYKLFGKGSDLDVEPATKYIRDYYHGTLSSAQMLVAFESTGVVQRPLLLEVTEKYEIALVRVCTPKEICLERVAKRNLSSKRPMKLSTAAEFFDFWTNEIAPAYHFALKVDGVDECAAIQEIRMFVQNHENANE